MTNQQKIEIFKDVFQGRQDAYGEGDGLCVKEIVSNTRLKAHLTGKKRIGIYPLSPDIQDGSGCLMACYDIDQNVRDIAEYLAFQLEHIEIPTYIEKSKSKGFHVWVFFSEVIDAKIARAILKYGLLNIIDDLGITDEAIELFPKQTTIAEGNGDYAYGNYINLPLFGANVEDGKTVFLNPEADYKPYANQWQFLQSIKKVQPSELTEIMEAEEIEVGNEVQAKEEKKETTSSKQAEPDINLSNSLNDCEFFRYCVENSQKLSEPLWYAMLSNIGRFKNGKKLAHELSRDYPNYTKKETNKKFDHAQNASGPITCSTIAKRGFKCPSIRRCKAQAPAGLFMKIETQQKAKPKQDNWVSNDFEPSEDEKYQETPEERDIPSLPEECWRLGFDSYRKALANSTEACDEYHFLMYLVGAGLILKRHSAIIYGRKLYPNFYGCCVGNTGESRKSTAAGFMLDMLDELQEETPFGEFVKILRHLATPEGLLNEMCNVQQKEDDIPLSYSTLTFHNELASLMKKSQQSHASGLISRLTSLYDCPSMAENPTLAEPIQVLRPFLSMIGLSTANWLEDSLTERDVMGGFANRFLYVTGAPKPPIAFPDRPIESYWGKAKQALVYLVESTFEEGMYVELDDQAHDLWESFYDDFKARTWPNLTIQAIIQRIPDNILKIALVYARLEDRQQIDWKMLDAAIKVGNFCIDSVKSIFRLYGANEYSIIEAKILDALKELGGETVRRILHQKLSGRISATILQRNLESLHAMGRLKLWKKEYQDSMGRNRSRDMITLLK